MALLSKHKKTLFIGLVFLSMALPVQAKDKLIMRSQAYGVDFMVNADRQGIWCAPSSGVYVTMPDGVKMSDSKMAGEAQKAAVIAAQQCPQLEKLYIEACRPQSSSERYITVKESGWMPEALGAYEQRIQAAKENFKTGKSPAHGELYQRDMFDGAWEGSFTWDWHTANNYFIRANGLLSMAPDTRQGKLSFDIYLESGYKGVCVERLYETGRMADGLVLRLEPKIQTSAVCNPDVAYGYLSPTDDGALAIVLYDKDSAMISNASVRSQKSTQMNISDDAAKWAYLQFIDIKEKAGQTRVANQTNNFYASPEFKKIEPLFKACKAYVTQKDTYPAESYCQCVSQKFGLGGRLSEADVALYSRDFGKLDAQIKNFSNGETFYTRLGRTCSGCSNPERVKDSPPYCRGEDEQLYSTLGYEGILRFLINYPEKLKPVAKDTRMGFYIEYLKFYSGFCKAEIIDPVPFTYTVKERGRRDIWGPEYERQVSESKTYVERAYAAGYQQCYEDINAVSGAEAMKKMDDILKGPQSYVKGVKAQVDQMLAERMILRSFFEKGCHSPDLQKAYRNLPLILK